MDAAMVAIDDGEPLVGAHPVEHAKFLCKDMYNPYIYGPSWCESFACGGYATGPIHGVHRKPSHHENDDIVPESIDSMMSDIDGEKGPSLIACNMQSVFNGTCLYCPDFRKTYAWIGGNRICPVSERPSQKRSQCRLWMDTWRLVMVDEIDTANNDDALRRMHPAWVFTAEHKEYNRYQGVRMAGCRPCVFAFLATGAC